MANGTILARLIGSIGVLLVPAFAMAQGAGCWLRDAAAPTPSTVYILCEQGTVHITTNAGGTWTARDTGFTNLRAMASLDENHVVAVGDGGLIIGTDDGGKTWQERLKPDKQRFTAEHLLSLSVAGNQLWASGFDGELLHSADGGQTWEVQTSGTHQALENVFFLDANHGWAVGWSGTILRTADGGKKWEDVKTKAANWSLTSVYFRDVNNGWAAGFGGQMLRSRDGGATWAAQDSTVRAWLKDVKFDKSNRAWATADEQFLVSEDGGEKWRAVKSDKTVFLRKLLPVGDKLWAIGQLSVLKQDAGLAWKPIDSLVAKSASQVSATRLVAAPKVPAKKSGPAAKSAPAGKKQ